MPKTAAGLAVRFRTVLGATATFTYAAPSTRDPYIVGTLTNRSTGRRGGFDLQIVRGTPGDKAQCEDADRSHCQISTLDDGSSLSLGHEPLNSRGATLYLVALVHADGVTLVMHVSNQADPKGSGPVLSDQPPLSRHRIVAILRSDRW